MALESLKKDLEARIRGLLEKWMAITFVIASLD